ncbi:MAG: putative PLP-dependent enzyme involved in cell wall biosis [Solirubrobacterales bacterium]|nr:putative PLP-dependent enzyme involved in cell wall biosis [Solirubrobacterales bacterium]
MNVVFAKPYFGGGESEALAEVIASGWVSQGPRVRAFEQAFAARVGAAEAVAVTNCTSALALALHASGVGPGDEVIIPSLSFIATANAVHHCGAIPVFADIDPRTYNLDPRAAEAAITPRTAAIMPVHQVGLPADMDAFFAIADARRLVLVEDAACAIGATHQGRPVGSLGPLACFSLHPRKVITTGEGGMITTNDVQLAERLRRLRQHGMDLSDLARHGAADIVFESYPEKAWNLRMTDLQAALGLKQLEVLDEVLAERRRLAARYTQALAGIPCLAAPAETAGAQRTWQSYPVRVLPGAPLDRTGLMRRLHADGIATRRGIMAIHHEPAYADVVADLPHTDAAAADVLLLPLYAGLRDAEQDHVIDRLGHHALTHAA